MAGMMRKIVQKLLKVALGCLLSTSLFASSPVWKVTHGENTLYLAGTIHVLSRSDYPLPEAFDLAYSKSKRLIFETDIDQIKSPEMQRYFLSKMAYQDGHRLNQFLSAETFLALEDKLQAQGIPIQNMMGFKPGFVGTTLTVLELQRLGMAEDGVDDFFFQKAKTNGKPIGQLETVESQIDFISQMGVGNEDALIRHMLDEINQIPQLMAATKTAWRKGELSSLEEVLLTPLVEEYPDVYQTLLVNRNNLWMPQLYRMLDTPETEFVLVGALHLIGKDGLLEQLQAKGYHLEQLR